MLARKCREFVESVSRILRRACGAMSDEVPRAGGANVGSEKYLAHWGHWALWHDFPRNLMVFQSVPETHMGLWEFGEERPPPCKKGLMEKMRYDSSDRGYRR
jgi:hypothetical protein